MVLNPLPALHRRTGGFTLIELMIAVAIVAIIAALALPAYNGSIRKSRRSDAMTALSAVQQAQERWRSSHEAFAGSAELTPAPTATPPGLGLQATSSSGHYSIAISTSSATGYAAVATAVAGSSQAQDGNCKVMGVQLNGGNLKYGSDASSINWGASDADVGHCWAK